MSDVSNYVAARRYLAPFPDSLWRWDDAGKVVEWSDGTTIAFRQEIESIVRRLAPHWLPPMNAVVLLLAACRDSWPGMSGQLNVRLAEMATARGSVLPDWVSEVVQGLDRVRTLPIDLRNDIETKTVLAEMIFDSAGQAVSRDMAAKVLQGLAQCVDRAMMFVQQRSSRTFSDLLAELRVLKEVLPKVNAESLRMRRKTGLDGLIRPADVSLSPADRVRRLLAETRDDEILGGVSRMAGRLMAAMNLPRPIDDRDDLPVGGVSDISNRGQLDRLLISELAHDDLTLAVRVAVGEALYLRREAPPRNPPRRRAVLIDAGIRMWGVPRVFATAVALAVAATADRKIAVDLFRADGTRVVPVDLTCREGLVEQLAAMAIEAHPGAALAPFLDAAGFDAEKGDAPGDTIVITGDDVLADGDFRRAAASTGASSLFFAAVNRQGRFRLLARGTHSDQLISEAQLNLEDVLAARDPVRPKLIDERRSADLPAILRLKTFPLLLGYQPIDPQRHWAIDGGPGGGSVLGITQQGSLVHWQQPKCGARLLAGGMPEGLVHWTSSGAGSALAVVGQLHKRQLSLLRVSMATGDRNVIPLEIGAEPLLGVAGHGGVVFAIHPKRVNVFDTLHGRLIASLDVPPELTWKRDRFFAGRGDWYALAYDGTSARFESALKWGDERGHRFEFLTFVDVPGQDGPWGITSDGILDSSSYMKPTVVAHGLGGKLALRAVARNGQRVVVSRVGEPGRMALVEIPSATVWPFSGNPDMAVEPALQQLKPRSLRHRFQGAFVGDGGRLSLLTIQGGTLHIDCNSLGQIFLARSNTRGAGVRTFRPLPAPSPGGYELQVAAWDDGSKAFLDSRGMLHLISSDASVPEFSLVLTEGPLAGWSADGRLWGPSYFTGKPADGEPAIHWPARVYCEIIQPFVARLR